MYDKLFLSLLLAGNEAKQLTLLSCNYSILKISAAFENKELFF